MTKKDYKLIADAILSAKQNTNPLEQSAISTVVHELANRLQNENPRFDRERFLSACGF